MFKTLLWFVALNSVVLAQHQFSIGAIFNDEKDENEIAFRAVVDRVNVHERKLKLTPIIVYADLEDSFLVEKAVCNLISEGVIVIFGPSSPTSGTVSAICSSLQIPHIIYDWIPEMPLNERDFSSMTLNLYPENMQLSKAYADIVKSFSWKSYTVIYETDRDLMEAQDILQIHNPGSTPVLVRQLNDDEDYRPFLKEIKTLGEPCIVLHCSTDKILSILRQANELKMLGEYQSYFLAPLDTHTLDLDELQFVEANVTTVRIMDPTNFDVKNIVYDWEQQEKRRGNIMRYLPDKVKTNMLLINDAVWIFAKALSEFEDLEQVAPPKVECRRNKPWSFGKPILDFIKGKTHEGATGKITFNEHGQRTHFTVRVMELSSSSFSDIAVWNPMNGITEVGPDVHLSRKVVEKLQNKTFIVSSRIGKPFLKLRDPKDGEIYEGNARYEGYSMDLIDNIAKFLGFKYKFEITPDEKYGSYDPVLKKWNGIIGQILEGKADLGICDLTMTSARRKVVDFTPPFMTLGISILYSKPEAPPPDLFSFLSPFSLDVWIYMATAYLGVSLLLYALARMAPDEWENPHPCNPEPDEVENVWTMSNTTWLAVGSIMGMGCDILPKAASTRLVTGMWWFFALMMLNSYTANLAAFLTMSRMDSSIESAEDLSKQTKIKYGAVLGGSTLEFFKGSNFSTYQRMWAAMESARPSVFTKSNDEGVERVLKGKSLYAFFMESTSLEFIVERKCELTQVGGWLDYKTYGIAMPFNSPYRKQISKAVLKLGESGTLAELKRRWWKERLGGGNCSTVSQQSSETPELDIENVGGVFLVLGVGLSIALFIGIMEFLWNVKKIAIEEKVTPQEAFRAEADFALKFWLTTKPVNTTSASGSTSKRSSKSNLPSETRSTKSSNNNGNQISSAFSVKTMKSDKKIQLNGINNGLNKA